MKYVHTIPVKMKTNLISSKLFAVSLLLAVGSVTTTLPALSSAQGGSSADTSVCNNESTISSYKATMPAGTIKARANPNFAVSGVSSCAAQFNVRIVAVTHAYVYDSVTRTYNEVTTMGYPITETTKDMVVKPGTFSLSIRLADKPADQVLQMRTEMHMYMSTSFDANGNLLPGAVQLATGTANWTQTNFITL